MYYPVLVPLLLAALLSLNVVASASADDPRISLAEGLLHDLDFGGAHEILDATLADDTLPPQARVKASLLHARISVLRGDSEAARKLFVQVLTDHPDAQLGEDALPQSIAVFEQARAQVSPPVTPAPVEAFDIGESALQQMDFAAALSRCGAAIGDVKRPAEVRARARVVCGEALANTGDTEGAVAHFGEALKLDEKVAVSPESGPKIAVLLERARTERKRAAATVPTSNSIATQLAQLRTTLSEGANEAAYARVAQVLENPNVTDAERIEANMLAGRAAFVMGDVKKARTHFRDALNNDPTVTPAADAPPEVVSFFSSVVDDAAGASDEGSGLNVLLVSGSALAAAAAVIAAVGVIGAPVAYFGLVLQAPLVWQKEIGRWSTFAGFGLVPIGLIGVAAGAGVATFGVLTE